MENITFIYAGAGSGKTHKLTSILVDKIRSNDIEADEVLLTTFTKKASLEIKERAQQELLNNKLFESASKLNKAYIGTVHSVGYKFIQKYYYLLGLSPEIKELGDNEKEMFFAQAISEVPSDDELQRINGLVEEFNFHTNLNEFPVFDPSRWITDVKELIGLALTNQINLVEDESSLNHTLDVQNTIFDGSLTPENLLQAVRFNISLVRNNPVINQSYDKLTELTNLIESKVQNEINLISELIELDTFLKKIKETFSAGIYDAISDQIREYDVSKTNIFKEKVTEYTQLIFSLAARSISKYIIYKTEKGLIDFTDMEVNFLRLLEIEEVKEDVRQSMKMVMVDEFQDSNPIQLAIFMKLSKLVQQSYWVGDPKQSIYGFRGSDPVLIDSVIDCFTQQNSNNLNVEVLKMSWRSDAQLVNFSNAIFTNALQDQIVDIHLNSRDQINGKEDDITFNEWKQNVSINPLQGAETISLFPARGQEERLIGIEPLNFINYLQPGANGTKAATNEQFFHSVVSKVKKLINDNSIQVFDKYLKQYRKIVGSDICLLIDSNDKVSKLAEELKSNGLETNAIIPGLTHTIEYRFVKNISTLLLDKSNALAKTELAFLNGEESDWKDLIKKRIDLVLSPSTDETEFREKLSNWLNEARFNEVLSAIQTKSKHLSISYIIKIIVNQFNLFLKVSAFGKYSSRQSNLMRLIELAEEYEESALKLNIGTSLNGFFNFIETFEVNDIQKGANTEDAVQIMTYHKSKGLEWPFVFMLSLDQNRLKDFFKKRYFTKNVINQGGFEIQNPLSNRVIEFLWWPFGTKKSINENLQLELEGTELYSSKRQQTINESKRLFYVGLTRARDALFLTSNKNKSLNWLEHVIPGFNFENSYSTLNLNYLDSGQIDLFNIGLPINYQQEIFNGFEYIENSFESIKYFNKSLPQIQDRIYDVQPSHQPPLTNTIVKEVAQIHDRLKFNAIETDVLGNALHTMLYVKNKPYFEENVKRINQSIDLGISPNCFIENTEKFEHFIQTNFSPINQYCELYLEQVIRQQSVKGEADLVLELENELILIDYKSFPGKASEIFSKTSDFYAGKYSGQLAIYAEMLESTFNKPVKRQLIYYVVQGLVVELEKE